jgi:hypothetical protein
MSYFTIYLPVLSLSLFWIGGGMIRRPEVMSGYLTREAEAKCLPSHILKLLRYLLLFSTIGVVFSFGPIQPLTLFHSVFGLGMCFIVGRWLLQWEHLSELILSEKTRIPGAVRKFGIVLLSWGIFSVLILMLKVEG